MLYWTDSVETAIVEMEEDPFALGNLLSGANENMNTLVELIRGPDLTIIKRKALTALITHEVHNREIIVELTNIGVETIDDFAWKKCLRYYLDQDEKDNNQNVVVR